MSSASSSDVKLEIGHVLFIDIVGYSKLLINEQSEQMQKLREIVRGTKQFRTAEAEGKLLRLPTGDGGALVFRTSVEAPVLCALEISKELKKHPELRVRMGIHSGPVNEITDLNEQANIAGAGINIAQRVMDCGDAGHVLLSRHVAEDLEQYPRWRSQLHDLGECEVKHGVRLGLVNLSDGEIGNAALPKKFQAARQRRARVLWVAVSAVILIVAGTIVAFFVVSQRAMHWALTVPEKSIAVLPFENLTVEKQNEYFAVGVQDQILTDLSQIADLKVISRTSVMSYKSGVARNLREIARELGVAHVVEGSVQRAANKIRVNAQLIDARNDAHLWAQTYDRDLADVFAIQSEIAKTIADQLQAKLSPSEKAAIEQQPTSNLEAYDLYTRAKIAIERSVFNDARPNLYDAVGKLEKAVKSDPSFVLAYYQLAHAHDQIYLRGIDKTPARLRLANAAIEKVRQLQPDSAEAYLAAAKHFYWGYRDYDRARQELESALKTAPNDPTPYLLLGYVDRRQGQWDASIREMQRAVDLDPQNAFVLHQFALTYQILRRYPEAGALLDKALRIMPNDTSLLLDRATVEFSWRGDTSLWHRAVEYDSTRAPDVAALIDEARILLALYERDFAAASAALKAAPPERDYSIDDSMTFSRDQFAALVAYLRGGAPAAAGLLNTAHASMEKLVRDQPQNASAIASLAMIDAALGGREMAVLEAQRAVELVRQTKDVIDGASMLPWLAIVFSWSGQIDNAIETLGSVTAQPGYLSYGELKHSPFWDALRGHPRFEKIVASLAPKQ